MVETSVCEVCNEASATGQTYGPFESLCAACLHDLEVRDALDRAVVKLIALARRDPEAALRGWSEFYENNRHRARGDWLRLIVGCHRADVLLVQQRWADAEHELSELLGQVERGSDLQRSMIRSMASALDGLGRAREAIDMLCGLVLESPDMSAEDVLSTLHMCARIAKTNNITMPEAARAAFDAAGAEYGIARELSEPEPRSLIELIEEAHRQRLEAQDRYVKILDDLKTMAPSARREHLIRYAQREPVKFFRDMASRYACEDG